MTWDQTRLDECCEIVSGATPKTAVPGYWGGDVPWATPKDLSTLPSPFISETARTLTPAGLESCGASVLPAQSVLFTSRAPIGHVAINTVPMATNQGFKSLVPRNGEVHPKFLYWWLRVHRVELQALGSGATFKEISKKAMGRIQIPLPAVEEQERVAHILDVADSIWQKRERFRRGLDELEAAMFLDTFGDPVDNPHRFPTRRLSELVDGDRGITYGVVQRGDDVDDGVPVLRITDVIGGVIEPALVKRTATEISEKYRRTKLHGGEVVISIRGTVGRCARVPDDLAGGNITRELALVPLLDPGTAPFVLSVLRSDSIQRRLATEVRGAAQRGINLRDLRELPVVQPPKTTMAAFLDRIATVEHVRAASQDASCTLDALCRALQDRAFRGEL